MKLTMLEFVLYCSYYKMLTSRSMDTCTLSIVEGITHESERHFPEMA